MNHISIDHPLELERSTSRICSAALRTPASVWIRCLAMGIAGLSIAACAQKPAASGPATAAAAPQGDSYDSIKQLPDWSGVWVLYMGQLAGGDDPKNAQGQSILTPRYKELETQARTAHAQANMSNCLPAGATAILQHGVLWEILFTPQRVTMLFEDGEVRRIYTDGRAHRPLSELTNSFMGDSIGHWEGKTLVVDTIGFPKGELFQNNGLHVTKNTHLVERIFLNDQGRLQIDSVVTDPEIFSEPYSYTREYQHASFPLTEPVCAQNNRDTGTSIDLTPPPEDE